MLILSHCTISQISVRATDGGDPALSSAPMTATVTILRNDFTPQITSSNTVTIREDHGTINPVITIIGLDQDTTVREHQLCSFPFYKETWLFCLYILNDSIPSK